KKPAVETSEAKASVEKPKDVQKNFGPLFIEDWISDSKDEDESKPKIEKKTVKPCFAKIEFVKSKEQVKTARKTTVKQVEKPRQNTHRPRGNQRNWNNMMSQRLGSNLRCIIKLAMFVEVLITCSMIVITIKNRYIVPKAVLMKSCIKSVNAARPNFSKVAVTVNNAIPVNTACNSPKLDRSGILGLGRVTS
nr:hypothetical protein [Tanacetum cinerariifolium]